MFWIYFFIVNILAYLLMWTDKIKASFQKWRISETTLWIFASIGGVFGIWLGMQTPLYHKAGKRKFRILVPIIAGFWIAICIYILYRK